MIGKWIQKLMARPRIVRLEGGEVSLLNFPKETAEALVEHIKAFKTTPTTPLPPIPSIKIEEQSSPTTLAPQPNIIDSSSIDMKDKAIGIHLDLVNQKVVLVTVDYDIMSGVAKVSEKEDSPNVREAITKFKLKSAKLNFV